MNELQREIEHLEKRLDDQAARIDALYRLLGQPDVLPRAGGAGRGDAFSDEIFELEEEPSRQPRRTRFCVGTATGV